MIPQAKRSERASRLPRERQRAKRPVAERGPQRRHRLMVPAPGSGDGAGQLLPAPYIGRWVDGDDLAGVLGG